MDSHFFILFLLFIPTFTVGYSPSFKISNVSIFIINLRVHFSSYYCCFLFKFSRSDNLQHREETFSIELVLRYCHFNFKMISSWRQSATAVIYIKSRYQKRNLIRRITLKIFMEMTQEWKMAMENQNKLFRIR